MTNADLPAFPQPETHDAGKFTGFSKREAAALIMMAALINRDPEKKFSDVARFAALATDLLLSELEKTKSKP